MARYLYRARAVAGGFDKLNAGDLSVAGGQCDAARWSNFRFNWYQFVLIEMFIAAMSLLIVQRQLITFLVISARAMKSLQKKLTNLWLHNIIKNSLHEEWHILSPIHEAKFFFWIIKLGRREKALLCFYLSGQMVFPAVVVRWRWEGRESNGGRGSFKT